jgi:hypothetical protein
MKSQHVVSCSRLAYCKGPHSRKPPASTCAQGPWACFSFSVLARLASSIASSARGQNGLALVIDSPYHSLRGALIGRLRGELVTITSGCLYKIAHSLWHLSGDFGPALISVVAQFEKRLGKQSFYTDEWPRPDEIDPIETAGAPTTRLAARIMGGEKAIWESPCLSQMQWNIACHQLVGLSTRRV